MAALIRCSHLPSRQFSGHRFRLPRLLPPESPAGVQWIEDMEFIAFGKKRLPMFSVRADVTYEKSQILCRSNSIYYGADNLQMALLEETHESGWKLLGLCNVIIDDILDQQKGALFNFLKAWIIVTISLLILPPKVLAETCEVDSTFSNMPLLFAIALIGATVGGLLARQRRGELERLNGQLRQINTALRRQAVRESYAPSLSYAPVGRIAESEVIVDPKKQELLASLRTGKKFLRNQDPGKAYVEFKTALELAQDLGDHVEEKKAARGLGASLQRQGKYREAIKYYSRILEICKQAGDDSGSTEAYGAIADCYTELGDLERAGQFYDKYIARLETD